MKRENLEKAKNAIEQAQHIEYVIGCINNDPTCVIRGWDWVPRDVNSTYVERILLNLTDHEKICPVSYTHLTLPTTERV